MVRYKKIIITISLACLVLMCCFVFLVFVPFQNSELVRRNETRGSRSDLYPPWYGSRELLLKSRDPYSQEVSQEIFRGVYGRSRSESDPNLPKDEARFVYPLFTAFLFAPTVTLPFPIVQKVFGAIFAVSSLLAAILWCKAFSIDRSGLLCVTATILFLGTWPVVEGIRLGQMTLLSVSILAGASAAFRYGYFGLAGVLLGLGTFKPQLIIPLTGLLMLFTFFRWSERKQFAFGFFFTAGLLFAVAEFLSPGWIFRWLPVLSDYASYQRVNTTVFGIFFGPVLGPVLASMIWAAVGFFCWRNRHVPLHSSRFSVLLVLVVCSTDALSPFVLYTNHVLLFPVTLLAVAAFQSWEFSPEQKILLSCCLSFIASTWLIATAGCISRFLGIPFQSTTVGMMFVEAGLEPIAALLMAFILSNHNAKMETGRGWATAPGGKVITY